MRINRSQASTDIAGATAPRSTRRLRVALGTWVAIEARAVSAPREPASTAAAIEQAAIEAAYAAIGAVEQAMHPHRPGSDLARINAAPLQLPIEIQPDTWRVLQLARRLHDLTDGVFDPCLPAQPGRLQDVELGSAPMLVCHAPVEIDLGGIAKGYAIDRAVETLGVLGCSAGLVNAGGDLRVFGQREETILLRHLDDADAKVHSTDRIGPTGRISAVDSIHDGGRPGITYRQLALKNAALAVSDLDVNDRPVEHRGYYNRTGQTATCRYAAVIAPTAATADALTKCVLFCSPERAALALRELEATSA